jgi:hypothetical protein
LPGAFLVLANGLPKRLIQITGSLQLVSFRSIPLPQAQIRFGDLQYLISYLMRCKLKSSFRNDKIAQRDDPMILIYLDESGTNYTVDKGLYKDGPFLIFGAICVNEDVYWSMERLFCELVGHYFSIDDWLNSEIHATDIWFGKSLSSGMTTDKRREFFDEFLQLCGKFELPYVYSFTPKRTGLTPRQRNFSMMTGAHCLLLSIEHKLAELHQTGVLICDSSTNSDSLKMKDTLELDIDSKQMSSAQALLRQFNHLTAWRTTRKQAESDIKFKYRLEAMSAYLIDRIHFLHSDDSLFLQMCDILTFIVQRGMTYDYLKIVDPPRAEQEMVPFTMHGFATMKLKVFPCFFEETENDVLFCQDQQLFGGNECITQFPDQMSQQLKNQYDQMQQTGTQIQQSGPANISVNQP